MKYFKNLTVLMLVIASSAARTVSAQEKVIYSFPSGATPTADLVQDAAGNLYGMTTTGGTGNGSVFELSPSSGGSWTEKDIYVFGTSGPLDGAKPSPPSGLFLDGKGNLYGTTEFGGKGRVGTIFELSPASGGTWTETVLWNFPTIPGVGTFGNPRYGVILDANGNIYGLTSDQDGRANNTVFELSPSAGGSWKFNLIFLFPSIEEIGRAHV